MGMRATKAAGNKYYQCREAAAKYNDRLRSREGAAELLGISVSSLADYELGVTKIMPVEVVMRMADLYGAPELRNYYCRHECPLGAECVPELACEELDRVSLKILGALNRGDDIKDVLLAITEDGEIDEGERPQLDRVIDFLDKLSTAAAELKLWAEKCRMAKEAEQDA